jgi:hypothetical protein
MGLAYLTVGPSEGEERRTSIAPCADLASRGWAGSVTRWDVRFFGRHAKHDRPLVLAATAVGLSPHSEISLDGEISRPAERMSGSTQGRFRSDHWALVLNTTSTQ